MTARVLVVDDILPNVKLLEAKLSGEYFDVITAQSGAEGIEKAEKFSPDIILLDVMMPGMDGFETCQRLKSSPLTGHIPVVMVTALTDATDRVRGLEAGADDFLSKPVNDVALMARVRSLVRLKMTVDEWRIRENTANQFGFVGNKGSFLAEPSEKARVMVIEDKSFESDKFIETLKRDEDSVMAVKSGEQAIALAQQNEFDIIIVSLNLGGEDGLRLCSHLRSNERTRSVPILMVGEETDMKRIAQGLEIGAHDYILRPVDRNELLARVRTQIRRKRYQDRLRSNYEMSLSLALTDSLTGLFNRRYLMVHLEKLLNKNKETKKALCVLMLDIDHFKKINDTHGHAVGDEVLKSFAERISQRLRSFDLVARLGGEEFVVVLPDISLDMAFQVSERLRNGICRELFKVSSPQSPIPVTVSIGAALISGEDVTVEEAIKRADDELYRAKEGGRNRVYFAGHGLVTLPEAAPPAATEEAIKTNRLKRKSEMTSPFTTEALQALVHDAFPAFKAAGDKLVALRQAYDGAGEVEKDEDGYRSIQTKADLASDEIMCAGLSRLTPDIPVVSEENVYDVAQNRDLTQGRFWIVDPMDGTAHFRAGRDTFAVLGAFIEDRRPVLGIIYRPAQKDGASGYYAVRGGGAYAFRHDPSQRQRLYAHPSVTAAPIHIGLEGCYFPVERITCAFPHQDIANMDEILGCYQRGVFELGAKTIAGIAENRIDFSAFVMDKCAAGEWDIAAPALLLREAGAFFTDLYGQEILFGTPQHKVPAFAAYRSPAVFERFRKGFFGAYDDVQGVFVPKAA